MKTVKKCITAVFALTVIVLAVVWIGNRDLFRKEPEIVFTEPSETQTYGFSPLEAFAQQNDLALSQWPEELLQLLEASPEAEEYVLGYPLLKHTIFPIDLSDQQNTEEVPLLLQWDQRWGYGEYGGSVMGISGCGPTCLSMVCLYLLDEQMYDPWYIAQFSMENGYCEPGAGSTWTLISEGGVRLGLDVVEIPLDEKRLIKNLEVGNPVICVMGPGDFTTTGHFIVMTGYENGMIQINDPNSISRSEKDWRFEDIQDQIRNLWVCRLP